MKRTSLILAITTLPLFAASGPALGRQDSHEEGAGRARDVVVRAVATGKARTFASALIVSGLVETLQGDGPFTVLVPTDDAFAKLPAETLAALFRPENKAKLAAILSYHVIPGKINSSEITAEPRPRTVNGARLTIAANGKGIAIDDATVVQADLLARNGVVHFIDRVLSPARPSIVSVAEKAGFETLVAALRAAKLEDDLKADGPFTVFAPTDAAFAKLGKERLASLLEPKNRQTLEEILKYHVVKGRVTARDAVAAGRARTLQGGRVEATIADGRLRINGADVSATDVEAQNGLIHAIDSVLIPR